MTSRPAEPVRALRWWLRGTGALTFAAGVACLFVGAGWLPGVIVGIGLVVYGIAALTTQVGLKPAGR